MRDLRSAMMDTLVVNFNVRKEFVMAIISDLEDTLMTNSSGKIRIGEKVTTVMFADDLVLLADSSAGLKQSLLTLGAHAQRGLQYLVCVSVCLSVTTFSATTRNKPAKKRHQRVQRYTGLILKLAIFVKALRSRVMA